MGPWIIRNQWNQINVANGFDFIRKIEGSVLFEQVCMYAVLKMVIETLPYDIKTFPLRNLDVYIQDQGQHFIVIIQAYLHSHSDPKNINYYFIISISTLDNSSVNCGLWLV